MTPAEAAAYLAEADQVTRARVVGELQQAYGNEATSQLVATLAKETTAPNPRGTGGPPRSTVRYEPTAPRQAAGLQRQPAGEASTRSKGLGAGMFERIVRPVTELWEGAKRLHGEGARFILGVLLPPDIPRMRWQIERITAQGGRNGLHEYYGRLTRHRSRAQQVVYMSRQMEPDDPRRPTPHERAEAELEIRLIDLFEEQYLAFRPEIEGYISEFQTDAAAVTETLLGEALARVEAESQRYGLASVAPVGDLGSEKVRMAEAIRRMRLGSMPGTLSGLSDAGERLAKHLGDAAAASDALITANDRLFTFRAQPLEVQAEEEYARVSGEAEQLARAFKQAVRSYYLVRDEEERNYPLLAEWSHDFGKLEELEVGQFFGIDAIKPVPSEKLKSLGQIASSPHFAQFHGAMKVLERQRDIADFRERVRDDSDVIWKFDVLLDLTMQDRDIDPGSWQARVITDHARHRVVRGKIISLGLGVLSFALGLLAIPFTGGMSAVGMGAAAAGAGVAGYSFHRELQEYRLKKAAVGTEFDKARAIAGQAPEEPSLFWLALDIAGFGLDFAVAAKKFNTIVQLRRDFRATLRAGDAEMTMRAERALSEAGEEFGVGNRLVEQTRGEQAGGTGVVTAFHGTADELTRLGAIGQGRINVTAGGAGAMQDLGRGFYLTDDALTAALYASRRGKQRGGGLQHVLRFDIPERAFGKIVDIRPGGEHRAAWVAFLDEAPDLPEITVRRVGFRTNREYLTGYGAEQRGQVFERFLARTRADADTVFAPLGDDVFTGIATGAPDVTQICIRSQRAADQLNAIIRGASPTP
jgi:hypothetical protein